jgi:pyruvate-formate lyase-activating enzyme
MPLIPGVNLEAAHLDAAARFVAEIPGVQQVHLLPYHRLGTHKVRRVSSDTPSETKAVDNPIAEHATAGPTVAELEDAAGRMRAAGLHTIVGG